MLKQQFLTALSDTFAIFTGVGQQQYDNFGDLRIEAGGAGQAVYKFVKFTGTLASAIGDFMCYTNTSTQIVDGTNSAFPAGVAQAVVAGGAVAGVMWIQVSGKVTMNTPTAIPAGQACTCTGAANKSLKVRAAITDNVAGYSLNAAGSLIVLQLPLG